MNKYDIELHSDLKIGLPIPIHIHISKVKPAPYYSIYKRRVCKCDLKDGLVEPTSAHFFYGTFERKLNAIKILKIIYEFIDFESIKALKVPYLKIIGNTEEEFVEYGLETSYDDVFLAYNELLFYIDKIRQEFSLVAIESLQLDEEYPEITSKVSQSKTATYRAYKDRMIMPYELIKLKTALMESVLFKENYGKAVSEYSWRELELKKLYTTAENNYNSFIESVRGKIMDELSETKQ